MFLIPVLVMTGMVINACMDADDQSEAKKAATEELQKWRSVTEEGPSTELPSGETEGWALGSFPHVGQLWLTPTEATYFELAEDLDDHAIQVLRFIIADQANRGPGNRERV